MRSAVTAWAAGFLIVGAGPAAAQVYRTSAGDISVETIARGLNHPWSLAFLPDGRMLVTERPGRMRIVSKDGKLSPPVAGVPKVVASGQGGLLDVALDRGYAQNQTIYFCFAEPASGGSRTALARARLIDEGTPRLDDVKVIFRQEGPLSHGLHFGCRIVQTPDDNLFLTMGEHSAFRDEAQNLGNHLGKIVRIRPDGSVPPDNPFVGRAGRQAGNLELRPPQLAGRGAASADRQTLGDRAWAARRRRGQHPAGRQELRLAGDRLRHRLQRRENSREHAQGRHGAAGLALGALDRDLGPDVLHRRPVSGLARQRVRRRTGRPDCWSRLDLDGEKVVKEERLLQGLNERIRDVRQGPDGAIWLLTDASNGRIIRVAPAK